MLKTNINSSSELLHQIKMSVRILIPWYTIIDFLFNLVYPIVSKARSGRCGAMFELICSIRTFIDEPLRALHPICRLQASPKGGGGWRVAKCHVPIASRTIHSSTTPAALIPRKLSLNTKCHPGQIPWKIRFCCLLACIWCSFRMYTCCIIIKAAVSYNCVIRNISSFSIFIQQFSVRHSHEPSSMFG